MKKSGPYLFLFLLMSVQCMAQLANKPERQYIFNHYTVSSGLLSNQVNNVVQDEEGYIWIATAEGLQRYDGNKYVSFRHADNTPGTLPSNFVQFLRMDRNNNLWVVFPGGHIGIFDRKKFIYREADINPTLVKTKSEVIQQILTDDKGNVFIHYGMKEILVYNKALNKFVSASSYLKYPKDWMITDLIHQPGSRKYWLSVRNAGFVVFDEATGKLSTAEKNISGDPFIERYRKLQNMYGFHFDKKGRFWFMYWDNSIPTIYCYDIRSNTPVLEGYEINSYLQHYHTIDDFFEQKDGTIWIRGTPVLAKYLEDEKKFQFVSNGFMNEQSIHYEIVMDMQEDRENNLWVSTDNSGLYMFNPANEHFQNISHINRQINKPGDGDPMSFLYTRWGTILCGVWGNGIYHYDSNFNPIPTNIKGIDNNLGPTVWSMCLSRDSNTIWMGAQPGIWKVDQAKRSAVQYHPPTLKDRTIRQVTEDRFGNLWIGTHGQGVFKWDAKAGKTDFNAGISHFSAIPDGIAGNIVRDSKGYIWITSSNSGLYMVDPATDKIVLHFGEKEKKPFQLPEPAVSTILEYNDTIMLICTGTEMLGYDRKNIRLFKIANQGMISGFIAAMQRDRSGLVWLTTTNGLYRCNILKRVFVRFGNIDGINSEHFCQISAYTLPDGRMLFGTTRQFIVFNPQTIKFNESKPDLRVTMFKLENKALLVDSLLQLKELNLGYRSNSIVISFSTMTFTSAYAIKYKLEGLDKDWKFADKTNEAIYSYLPPGNYKFRMRSVDQEGNELEETIPILIRINPPFWKTWWFYSLLVLVAGGLLYWFDRERMRRKESIYRMRSNIADDLHQELNTALGNINILSEMARLKADSEPEKSKEFIEQIHNRSHTMMIAMDDIMWSISPENDSTEKLLLRLKEYTDALKNRYGVSIEIVMDEKVNVLPLNMKQRKDIFWLFKNGIGNAVMTGCRDCRISISFEKGILLYVLESDTTCCDLVQLNNLRQRKELSDKLKEINAVLDMQSSKNSIVFNLQIPLT
ncbi:MAG: triple tyrosine motif-containing protein [Bacteroidetes bacterium]|nr:triple tyrosine motif-containing protein [Bacteroidota bacterium]